MDYIRQCLDRTYELRDEMDYINFLIGCMLEEEKYDEIVSLQQQFDDAYIEAEVLLLIAEAFNK